MGLIKKHNSETRFDLPSEPICNLNVAKYLVLNNYNAVLAQYQNLHKDIFQKVERIFLTIFDSLIFFVKAVKYFRK